MDSRDVLLVVDVQNDFCPGGRLAVDEGDQVIPVLNDWIARASAAGAAIVASRDWHPPEHCSFRERGGTWPEHCVQYSDGAAFHPDLALPDDVTVISKGEDPGEDNYSAFDSTGLADLLRQRGAERVWVGGLAQDVCVQATVIDACQEGFETHLILPATRPVNVNPGDGDQAVEAMRNAGAQIETEVS